MRRVSSLLVLWLLLSVMIAQEARSASPVSSGDAPANPSLAPAHYSYPTPAKNPAVTRLSDIAKGMHWVGPAVSEAGYYVWCTSPIEGADGKTHLFVSRWPKKYRMAGWSTHCEIAHYIADRPEGPFKFHDVALPAHPDALWNNTMHNPCIRQVGNKYYLLYISFDRRPSAFLAEKKTPNYIGMAVADSLDGPWKILSDKDPLFLPSQDPQNWSYGDWQCTNPTFITWKGKYYIYFHGGKRVPGLTSYAYAYAVADKPEGPYKIGDHVSTHNFTKIEDGCAFVWKNKIYLLTDDNFGAHTGIPGAGLLWISDNPETFKLADAQIGFLHSDVYDKHIDPAKVRRLAGRDFKFERPGILMINGKPAYFYGASGFNLSGGDTPESYVMKINVD